MSAPAESVLYWSELAHTHAYTPFGVYCAEQAKFWATRVIGETV